MCKYSLNSKYIYGQLKDDSLRRYLLVNRGTGLILILIVGLNLPNLL